MTYGGRSFSCADLMRCADLMNDNIASTSLC
jgi:hypothetical protein